MPQGKPAGIRCVQLDDAERCLLFGKPDRPAVCVSLKPGPLMCGSDREYALHWISRLERQTRPGV